MEDPMECRMMIALADIAGFMEACKNRTDLEQFNMLNEFYNVASEVIGKANGRVVKFLGDAALIVFPEERAAEAVAALQDLQVQTQDISSEYGAACSLRINAHVGSLVCGTMGPGRQFDVIGSAVNELFLMPHEDMFHLSHALHKHLTLLK